jgi:hypothetical protein
MRWRHGRYRSERFIENVPDVTFFKPAGVPTWSLEIVDLSYPELESLRLVDLEGLTQEEAAAKMGISRRSLWTDLNSARKKVAYALSKGCALQLTAGNGSPPPQNEEVEEDAKV